MPDHTPDSAVAFARATASLMASGPQSVNSVICSSVAGSMIGITSPVPGRLRMSSSTACTVIDVSLLASLRLYLCRDGVMSVTQRRRGPRERSRAARPGTALLPGEDRLLQLVDRIVAPLQAQPA